MKISLGQFPNDPGGFVILGNTGRDITEDLSVKSISITANADDITKVVMEIYADVDVESDVTLVVNNGQDRADPSQEPS